MKLLYTAAIAALAATMGPTTAHDATADASAGVASHRWWAAQPCARPCVRRRERAQPLHAVAPLRRGQPRRVGSSRGKTLGCLVMTQAGSPALQAAAVGGRRGGAAGRACGDDGAGGNGARGRAVAAHHAKGRRGAPRRRLPAAASLPA